MLEGFLALSQQLCLALLLHCRGEHCDWVGFGGGAGGLPHIMGLTSFQVSTLYKEDRVLGSL